MANLSTEQKAKAKISDNVAEYDVFRSQGSELSAVDWQELFDLTFQSACQQDVDQTVIARDFHELAISAASSFGSDDSRTLLAMLLYAYHRALEQFSRDQLLKAGIYALSALEIEPNVAVDEKYNIALHP